MKRYNLQKVSVNLLKNVLIGFASGADPIKVFGVNLLTLIDSSTILVYLVKLCIVMKHYSPKKERVNLLKNVLIGFAAGPDPIKVFWSKFTHSFGMLYHYSLLGKFMYHYKTLL
jgi:cadmium resistance protein CadD (predicted permease)